MKRGESGLNGISRIKLYVLDILELTFFFAIVIVLGIAGLRHLGFISQPWWILSLPVVLAIGARIWLSLDR